MLSGDGRLVLGIDLEMLGGWRGEGGYCGGSGWE